jgi:hypothetical protein
MITRRSGKYDAYATEGASVGHAAVRDWGSARNCVCRLSTVVMRTTQARASPVRPQC